VTPSVVRLAAYRFRTTFSRRWGGYVTLVVLIGLLGGVALGALAGARRTQSSYSNYVASTNPSDLGVFTGFANPALGSEYGYTPAAASRLLRVPGVRSQQSVVGFDGNLAFVSGVHSRVPPGGKPTVLEGALGGEFTTQDRAYLVSGRRADPTNPGEAVMNAQAAQQLGIHIGSVVRFGLNTDAQEVEMSSPTGPSSLPAAKVASVRVVGLVVFWRDVEEDDYNALGSADVLLTPALTRQLAVCCATYSYTALKLQGGSGHLGTMESAVARNDAAFASFEGFQTTGPSIAAADRAIEPVSVALAVFGGLAAVALLVIVLQVIGRQLRAHGTERATMRALGATPGMTVTESLLGPVAGVAAGCVVAAGVAVAFSLLFPLGPTGSVTPVSADLDWTVLGAGIAAFFLVIAGVSVAMSYRQSPRAAQARQERMVGRPSRVMSTVATSGLPASAVTGFRFALEPGDRRDPVPVRSALLGAALAVVVVVGAVVFGASLNNLVSHPPLYGWNWNYALVSGFSGDEDLPGPQASHLLAHDPYVAASSGIYFVSVRINGQQFPVIGASPGARVSPPLLSGHALQARNQIVLGAETMALLHTHVGATVLVGGKGRSARTVPLTVVGTATMPALVGPGMGVGAIFDYQLIPPAVRNTQGSAVPGPNAYLIRTNNPSPAALRSLDRIVRTINQPNSPSPGSAGGVITVLRPEEIVDSRSIETIPAILGGSLAAGAAIALGITLVASVRRRRRDLAVLKTMGLSGRQLGAIVAWQSSVTVVIGTVVGVPLGIVLGHVLWNAFAEAIHAVPAPTVPALTVAAVALGAVVLANVVAAVPARLAARTRTAVLLRSE
jgi:FtsX-like permease family